MGRGRKTGRLAAAAGLTGMALAGAMLVAQPANAVNISNWNTDSNPHRCGVNVNQMCLYYHQGAGEDNGIRAYTANRSDLGGTEFGSGAGSGQLVKNNAASAENGSYFDNMAVYSTAGYQGYINSLAPNKGGDLTEGSVPMRNNEEAIKWY